MSDITLNSTSPAPLLTGETPNSRKLSAGAVARGLASRIGNPRHLYQAIRLQLSRKALRHAQDDAQLALYAQVLPSSFLHFGYFHDPTKPPDEIALSELAAAQQAYAELVLAQMGPSDGPVLDVGCGMGGMSRMLLERGLCPTALTPDRLQAAHVRAALPDVPVLRCKLERLPPEQQTGQFGAVLTAESLQYLKLDQALPILAALLRPGGRWVACDYFYTRPSPDRSCHLWDDFTTKLEQTGWRIVEALDITAHVLPTLAFAHMWATRFGLPLMDFAFLRLRRKQPGLYHLLEVVLQTLRRFATNNIEVIDPVQFERNKRYMLLRIHRANDGAKRA
jgi:cyclopropane fatty-acyl-phospholipid synthase-like methyltransferase